MTDHVFSVDLRMLHASGIGTYLQNLLPNLLSIHKDLKYNLLGRRQEFRQFPIAGNENVTLIDYDSPVYSLSEQIELFRKLPSDTALFWSPHYNIPLLPINAKKKIVTIHDVFHLAFFDQLSLKEKIYARLMLNAAVRMSDKIITVSNFSRSEIIKYTGADKDRITVIHNGIDRRLFRPITDKEKYSPASSPPKEGITILDNLRKKYSLPKEFIIFVGNVKPNKNLKRLLEAYELLIKKGDAKYGLVIIGKKEGFITGDSESFRFLKNSSSLQEKVLFTGSVDTSELPAVYNSASMLVFPSLYEGFGLPPLEAMACGCPVIVSNTASLPEVCGDAAYYVDPYSVESIAEGMNKVHSDGALREDLIQKGLERAGMFSWEESAKEHMNIFEEIITN